MTVKILTKEQQRAIAGSYKQGTLPETLATMYQVSLSTIRKVLREHDLGRPDNRQADEAKRTLKLVRKFGIKDETELFEFLAKYAVRQGSLFAKPESIITVMPAPGPQTRFTVGVVASEQDIHVGVQMHDGDKTIVVYSQRHLRGDSMGEFHLPTPAKHMVTKEEVQSFLNNSTSGELAAMFYTSGLIKVAEIHNTSVMNGTLKHQQSAQNAAQTNKKVSYAPKPEYRRTK